MNWRKVIVFAFLLGVTACHRKISVVAPPVAPLPVAPVVIPAALREAESAFDSGDFARSARAFESYLDTNPQTEDMDGIWFRYAVAQSRSGVPDREAASSDAFIRLIRNFPQSRYVPVAQTILALRANIAQMQADALRTQTETMRLQAEQNAQDKQIGQLTDDLNRAEAEKGQQYAEIARLASEQKALNDKIKSLNDDLDKLKKIDLDRRRTP
jgi:hypothetical protein